MVADEADSTSGPAGRRHDTRKVHPLLRMVADGSPEVNVARAEQSASIAVDAERISKAALRSHKPADERQIATAKAAMPAPPLKRVARGINASEFVQTTFGEASVKVAGETARRGDLVLAELPLDALGRAVDDPNVTFIEPGEALRRPRPRIESGIVGAPTGKERDIKIGCPSQVRRGRSCRDHRR